MKAVVKSFSALVLCAAMLISGISGCSRGGYPLSVDIDLTLGENFYVQDFGQAVAGEPLTPDTPIPPVEICTLPDRDDLDEMVRGAVGGFIAGIIKIERLELLEVKLSATYGDFNSLTGLSMYYRPKPFFGVEQPIVQLGETFNNNGLGHEIRLNPPQTVDFLEMIDDAAANPAPQCPKLGVRLEGVVPEVMPTWDIQVKIRVLGRVQI